MPTLTTGTQGYKSLFILRLARRARAGLAVMLMAGEALPRSIGSLLLSGFLSVVLLFGIVSGGHSASVFKMLTSTFGLAVTKIDIVSQDATPLIYISEIDILERLDLDEDGAMLAFDVQAAHERIVALPFVDEVTIAKIYPNRLHVTIKERHPLALWQHQGRLDVIDAQGAVIVPYNADVAGIGANLPLLVGRGANERGAQILELTAKFDHFKPRIRAYRRVADRRWDIVLDNGVEIKLPEHDFETRLAQMITLDSAQDLLARDVLTIDLRLKDRLSVTLSDEAMARWREKVSAAEKALKVKGRG